MGGCHVKPNSRNDFYLLFSLNLLIYIENNIDSNQVLNHIWPNCRSRVLALNIIFGWVLPIAFDMLPIFGYNLESMRYREVDSDFLISKSFNYTNLCLVA